MKYHKLVRDNIPEIIKNSGETPITHIASDKEYRQKLEEKLQEEVGEFLHPGSNKPEELADILEVIYALAHDINLTPEGLELIRIKKAQERGAFSKRIILEETH